MILLPPVAQVEQVLVYKAVCPRCHSSIGELVKVPAGVPPPPFAVVISRCPYCSPPR